MDDDALRAHAATALRTGAAITNQAAAVCVPALVQASRMVATSLQQGGKILVFGNGGSAAEAQHLAAELVGRYMRDRAPLAAVALSTDTSALTAIGNDYGFEQIFGRQVAALGRPGDVAIALSTSGKSPNLLVGVKEARAAGMTTIAFTGAADSPLAALVDITVAAPSASTPRVQECQLALVHVLCECVEAVMFPGLTELAGVAEVPRSSAHKVVTLDELVEERQHWRAEGQVVVWTSGCFDLVHVGHLQSLEAAGALGDVLIVGLNDDASVRALKGPDRPVVPASERAALIAALAVVDRVVVFSGLTPEAPLAAVQPEIHCKGADYAPPNGKPIPEQVVVEGYGGRVEFLPLVAGQSTTSLFERVRSASLSR